MNPFSALYYVKENKKRSLLLMVMIFLSFGVYVGGLYVTNPYDNWGTAIDYYDKMVGTNGNISNENYKQFLNEAVSDGKTTVIETGSFNGMNWNTVMGFDTGIYSLTFRSVSDFKRYCDHMGIECDFDSLKSGSMIMSEMFAKNRGLVIGDKVDKDFDWNIFREFTLDAVTNEDGYTLYFITDDEDTVSGAVLIGNGIEGRELYDYVYGLQNSSEKPEDIYVYQGVRSDLKGQFEIFDMIYFFIAILLSIILAVTINAAFVGMYQRREFEFSVYRAIGISKRRIVLKIAGELLLIDAAALLVGAAVTLLGLYLFNNLVLYPAGKYLRYYNSMALGYMILCNVIIIVPLMITRCRQMLRADICEE